VPPAVKDVIVNIFFMVFNTLLTAVIGDINHIILIFKALTREDNENVIE